MIGPENRTKIQFMQVAITTGEASGDRVAGELAVEIRRLRPDAQIWGAGGRAMKAAGVDVIIDTSRFGAIGVGGVIPLLPKILSARRTLFDAMKVRRPDVVVAVDAGAFHYGFGPIQGLCPWLRQHLPDTQIMAWMPPSSWRRTLKGSSLGQCTDAVSSPFLWNAAELKRYGVNAQFLGHPLIDFVKSTMTDEQASSKYGLDMNRPIVALMPGSREQEIAEILPVMLDAAYQMSARIQGLQFMLGLASTMDRSRLEQAVLDAHERAIARQSGSDVRLRDPSMDFTMAPVHVTAGGGQSLPNKPTWGVEPRPRRDVNTLALVIAENETFDLLHIADVAICVSGTVTLEAAILGTPMVIVYRLPRRGLWQYKMMKRRLPPFIGLPNLIAGKCVCPELLQDAVNADELADATVLLLLDPQRIFTMKEALRLVRQSLGEPGAVNRTAQWICDLTDGTSHKGYDVT